MTREKTLARRDKDLEQMEPWNTFRDMERMFRDFLSPMIRPRTFMLPEFRRELVPEVDLKETEKELILTASIPGLEKDAIDINVTSDRITVSGERKTEEEKAGEEYHVRQQSFGTFRVSYSLPVEVMPEDVKATYKSGVLDVHMPKAEVTEEHKVKVDVED